jgi:hypothetical protein
MKCFEFAVVSIAALASCTTPPAQHVAPQESLSEPTAIETSDASLEQEVREARAELASSDPAKIAWGAWRASCGKFKELGPDVLASLRELPALDAPKERVWVARALLDAAIQLDLRPEHEDLAWISEHLAQLASNVLILAARDPTLNTRLFESFDGQSVDIHWVAASNLLAQHAPHRIAPALVPQVRIEITVAVLDPNTGSGQGRHTNSIGCGGLEAPADFPPSVVYMLRERPSGMPNAIANGPIAVGYERSVYHQRSFGLGGRMRTVDRADYSLRLLRWIAGDRAAKGQLERRIDVELTWSDAETYVADVSAAIAARRAMWSRLLRALADDKVLDEADAATPAPLEIRVDDRRADKTQALPPLPS